MLKILNSISKLSIGIAMMSCLLMVLVTFVGVVCRLMGIEFLGNVELVQILLLILILFSMSYAQSKDRHIAIGIIVDKFPKRIQKVFDLVNYMATAVFCFLVAYAFFHEMMEQYTVTKGTTDIFTIPLYILKLVVAIGFICWGIEAIHRIIVRTKAPVESEEMESEKPSGRELEA